MMIMGLWDSEIMLCHGTFYWTSSAACNFLDWILQVILCRCGVISQIYVSTKSKESIRPPAPTPSPAPGLSWFTV